MPILYVLSINDIIGYVSQSQTRIMLELVNRFNATCQILHDGIHVTLLVLARNVTELQTASPTLLL